MTTQPWSLLRALGLAVAIVGASSFTAPAQADQNDPRLTKLFDHLGRTADASQARLAEAMIIAIWSRCDDPVAEALLRAGSRAMAVDQLESAMDFFNRAIERRPGFAEVWNRRAILQVSIGNLEKAAGDAMRALDLEPRHFGALNGLGQIFLAIDEPKAALDAFERALALNPMQDNARAYVEDLKRQLAREGL